jgi:hypothetical protein
MKRMARAAKADHFTTDAILLSRKFQGDVGDAEEVLLRGLIGVNPSVMY